VTTLKKLDRLLRPEWVILEASGVARPGDVVPVVRKYASMVDEIQVLVLVDAPRYEMLLEVMHPLVTAQIGAADIVAVNKIDALDEAGVERVASGVRELNGQTRVVAVSAEQGINLEALMGALR